MGGGGEGWGGGGWGVGGGQDFKLVKNEYFTCTGSLPRLKGKLKHERYGVIRLVELSL